MWYKDVIISNTTANGITKKQTSLEGQYSSYTFKNEREYIANITKHLCGKEIKITCFRITTSLIKITQREKRSIHHDSRGRIKETLESGQRFTKG